MASTVARHWLRGGIATTGAVLIATTVFAQESGTGRMPPWDVSGSVAVNQVRASQLRPPDANLYDHWEPQWEPGVQIGRYLTSHFKVEVAVRGPMRYRFYETDLVPVPTIPGGVGRSSVDTSVQVFSIAPAMTWQFLDNTFMHPFVSAGVAMDVSNVHRFREARTETFYLSRGSVNYPVAAIDTRVTEVRARPFVAVGSKSYFANGRWFVRPELQIGIGKSYISQVVMRLGVGVDF